MMCMSLDRLDFSAPKTNDLASVKISKRPKALVSDSKAGVARYEL